jgi:hypothetical protein
MARRMRKTFFIAATAALALAGCGNKTSSIHGGETEGIYVNVGELKYQVQISRVLNPEAIPEDREFVKGVDPAEADLEADERWFAVFVRVENDHEDGEPQPLADHFEIEDQQDTVYEPVELDETNEFRWDPTPLGPTSIAPDPDSIPGQLHSIGGMLQLYKVKLESLQNRPVELIIKSSNPEDESTVELDI